MKRAVGILLIVLAFVLATVGLCGALALAMAVYVPEFDRLIEPVVKRIVEALGIDPPDVAFLPPTLASFALGLGAVGQQLFGRTPPSQSMQVDVLDRTAA
jgi:hypothetical protein